MLMLVLFVTVAAVVAPPCLADARRIAPMEVAVDGSHNVYVVMAFGDAPESGVYVFAPDGTQVKSYTANGYGDVAIAGNGSLYLSSVWENIVERVDQNGSSDIFWREDRPGRFLNYIAVDRNGTAYISDYNYSDNPIGVHGSILKVSPDGAVLDVIESRPPVPMDEVFKMSVGRNGTIYLSVNSGHLQAIYPDGGRAEITPAGTGISTGRRLCDVAAGEDGFLYVNDATGGSVYKLTEDGAVVGKWDGCGGDRFATPFGIATDGQGRVYVSDMENQQVVWFDSNRYQYGENATENVAGKGVLWDVVVDGGNVTAAWPYGSDVVPVEAIPGYTAIPALACLGCAGIWLYYAIARRR